MSGLSTMSRRYHLKRCGLAATKPAVPDMVHFNKQETIFGRNPVLSDVLLDSTDFKMSTMISRRHAAVILDRNGYTIQDRSMNGVFLNDIKIADQANLTAGDRVTFGHLNGRAISPGTRVSQPLSEYNFKFEVCRCGEEPRPAQNEVEPMEVISIDEDENISCLSHLSEFSTPSSNQNARLEPCATPSSNQTAVYSPFAPFSSNQTLPSRPAARPSSNHHDHTASSRVSTTPSSNQSSPFVPAAKSFSNLTASSRPHTTFSSNQITPSKPNVSLSSSQNATSALSASSSSNTNSSDNSSVMSASSQNAHSRSGGTFTSSKHAASSKKSSSSCSDDSMDASCVTTKTKLLSLSLKHRLASVIKPAAKSVQEAKTSRDSSSSSCSQEKSVNSNDNTTVIEESSSSSSESDDLPDVLNRRESNVKDDADSFLFGSPPLLSFYGDNDEVDDLFSSPLASKKKDAQSDDFEKSCEQRPASEAGTLRSQSTILASNTKQKFRESLLSESDSSDSDIPVTELYERMKKSELKVTHPSNMSSANVSSEKLSLSQNSKGPCKISLDNDSSDSETQLLGEVCFSELNEKSTENLTTTGFSALKKDESNVVDTTKSTSHNHATMLDAPVKQKAHEKCDNLEDIIDLTQNDSPVPSPSESTNKNELPFMNLPPHSDTIAEMPSDEESSGDESDSVLTQRDKPTSAREQVVEVMKSHGSMTSVSTELNVKEVKSPGRKVLTVTPWNPDIFTQELSDSETLDEIKEDPVDEPDTTTDTNNITSEKCAGEFTFISPKVTDVGPVLAKSGVGKSKDLLSCSFDSGSESDSLVLSTSVEKAIERLETSDSAWEVDSARKHASRENNETSHTERTETGTAFGTRYTESPDLCDVQSRNVTENRESQSKVENFVIKKKVNKSISKITKDNKTSTGDSHKKSHSEEVIASSNESSKSKNQKNIGEKPKSSNSGNKSSTKNCDKSKNLKGESSGCSKSSNEKSKHNKSSEHKQILSVPCKGKPESKSRHSSSKDHSKQSIEKRDKNVNQKSGSKQHNKKSNSGSKNVNKTSSKKISSEHGKCEGKTDNKKHSDKSRHKSHGESKSNSRDKSVKKTSSLSGEKSSGKKMSSSSKQKGGTERKLPDKTERKRSHSDDASRDKTAKRRKLSTEGESVHGQLNNTNTESVVKTADQTGHAVTPACGPAAVVSSSVVDDEEVTFSQVVRSVTSTFTSFVEKQIETDKEVSKNRGDEKPQDVYNVHMTSSDNTSDKDKEQPSMTTLEQSPEEPFHMDVTSELQQASDQHLQIDNVYTHSNKSEALVTCEKVSSTENKRANSETVSDSSVHKAQSEDSAAVNQGQTGAKMSEISSDVSTDGDRDNDEGVFDYILENIPTEHKECQTDDIDFSEDLADMPIQVKKEPEWDTGGELLQVKIKQEVVEDEMKITIKQEEMEPGVIKEASDLEKKDEGMDETSSSYSQELDVFCTSEDENVDKDEEGDDEDDIYFRLSQSVIYISDEEEEERDDDCDIIDDDEANKHEHHDDDLLEWLEPADKSDEIQTADFSMETKKDNLRLENSEVSESIGNDLEIPDGLDATEGISVSKTSVQEHVEDKEHNNKIELQDGNVDSGLTSVTDITPNAAIDDITKSRTVESDTSEGKQQASVQNVDGSATTALEQSEDKAMDKTDLTEKVIENQLIVQEENTDLLSALPDIPSEVKGQVKDKSLEKNEDIEVQEENRLLQKNVPGICNDSVSNLETVSDLQADKMSEQNFKTERLQDTTHQSHNVFDAVLKIGEISKAAKDNRQTSVSSQIKRKLSEDSQTGHLQSKTAQDTTKPRKRRKTVTFAVNLEQFRTIENVPEQTEEKPKAKTVSLEAYKARNAMKQRQQKAVSDLPASTENRNSFDPRVTAEPLVPKHKQKSKEKSKQPLDSSSTIRRRVWEARVKMMERQSMCGDRNKGDHAEKTAGSCPNTHKQDSSTHKHDKQPSTQKSQPSVSVSPQVNSSTDKNSPQPSKSSPFYLIPVTVQRPSPLSSANNFSSLSHTSKHTKPSASSYPPYLSNHQPKPSPYPRESGYPHPHGPPHPHLPAHPHPQGSSNPPHPANVTGYRKCHPQQPYRPVQHTDVDPEEFIFRVLHWQPVWLQEQEKVAEPPPVVDMSNLCPLLETYENYEDYYSIFKPLLLLETWQGVTADWHKSRDHKMVDVMEVALTGMSNIQEAKVMDLQFQALIPQCPPRDRRGIGESDLVILTLSLGKRGEAVQPYRVFGYVVRSIKSQLNRTTQLHKLLQQAQGKQSSGRNMVQTMFVRTRYRKLPLRDEEMHKCQNIGSLAGNIRQYKALKYLRHSPLATDILRPTNSQVYSAANTTNFNIALPAENNASQNRAVMSAMSAVLCSTAEPRICLIQGPPGTGKTRTILSILELLMESKTNQRILLCAPSNSAVDELTRRLITTRHRMEDKRKGSGFKIVRYGNVSSIHASVRPYSLDDIVQRNMKMNADRELAAEKQSVKSAIDKINSSLSSLQIQRSQLQRGQENQMRQIDREINRLQKKKQQFDTRNRQGKAKSDQNEYMVRKDVLSNADVVCCTLSGSGNNRLADILRGGPRKGPHFSCVIIDEACQSIEADNLIPLQFGCSKMILFGDPYQLPPTVLSKKAMDLNYNQSLFERLYHYLKTEAPQAIVMLDTQYRMNKEICAFPASYVYNDQLKTHGSVLSRKGPPIKAYCLFDLEQAQEEESGPGSVWNPLEATFVLELCVHIHQSCHRSVEVCVITPYQRHRTHLENLLRERQLEKIKVNTVDSYQGQEKDIVIMSCVRAKSSNKGIGFVADIRRMNVSLTRAKHALYIVGHLKSLMVDQDWRALIENGYKRSAVVHIRDKHRQDFSHAIKRHLSSR